MLASITTGICSAELEHLCSSIQDAHHQKIGLLQCRIVELELAVITRVAATHFLDVSLSEEDHYASRLFDASRHLADDVALHLLLIQPGRHSLGVQGCGRIRWSSRFQRGIPTYRD